MPDITVRSGQRVNPILTNVARQTRPQGYVADLIAPRIQVPKEQVQYAVWGASDWSRTDVNLKKPDRSASKEIDVTVDWVTETLDEYAVKESISRRELANVEGVLQLQRQKLTVIQDALALAREARVAQILNTQDATPAGKLDNTMDSTPSNNWNVDAGTIEADILAAKEAIFDVLGYEPNTIVIPYKVANAIAIQQDIRELFKYTVNGQQTLAEGQGILPSKIWGLDVLIPVTRKATNAEGATDAFSEVWGDDVRVLYVNRGADYGTPSVAKTFQTRGPEVRQWTSDDPVLLWTETSEIVLEAVTQPFGGFVIKDVLS